MRPRGGGGGEKGEKGGRQWINRLISVFSKHGVLKQGGPAGRRDETVKANKGLSVCLCVWVCVRVCVYVCVYVCVPRERWWLMIIN